MKFYYFVTVSIFLSADELNQLNIILNFFIYLIFSLCFVFGLYFLQLLNVMSSINFVLLANLY